MQRETNAAARRTAAGRTSPRRSAPVSTEVKMSPAPGYVPGTRGATTAKALSSSRAIVHTESG